MTITPEWLSAIAGCIAACGVVVAICQLKKSASQLQTSLAALELSIDGMHADHDRSRREQAVALLVHWSNNVNKRGSVSRKFVETLDINQSKDLFDGEAITRIDLKHKELVVGCFDCLEKQRIDEWESNNIIDLNSSEVDELRWKIVSYLNMLETVLVAWRHNVADKDIIAEQFGFLVSKRNNHAILKEFRQAAGGASAFPAINDFEKFLSSKEKEQEGKSPLPNV